MADLAAHLTELWDNVAAKVVASLVGAAILWVFRKVVLRFASNAAAMLGSLILNWYRISSVRLVSLNRDRSDYAKGLFRGPSQGSIPEFIVRANKELIVVSISFITGVQFTKVETAFKAILARKGARIVISLIDPDCDEVVASVARTLTLHRDELQTSIRSSLVCLLDLRDGLELTQRDRLDIRVHKTIPFASAILIDVDEKGGLIQLETKPYKVGMAESFGFTLKKGGGHPLYDRLIASYRHLVTDGEPANRGELVKVPVPAKRRSKAVLSRNQ